MLQLPFDQLMTFWKTLETMHEIDPNEFIKFMMKQKIDSKKIRALRAQYRPVPM
jgi:hypothetical protein